jgi:hypothetical protein
VGFRSVPQCVKTFNALVLLMHVFPLSIFSIAFHLPHKGGNLLTYLLFHYTNTNFNLLANRLNDYLGELVNHNQSAFRKGMNISKNIWLAHELVKNYK